MLSAKLCVMLLSYYSYEPLAGFHAANVALLDCLESETAWKEIFSPRSWTHNGDQERNRRNLEFGGFPLLRLSND